MTATLEVAEKKEEKEQQQEQEQQQQQQQSISDDVCQKDKIRMKEFIKASKSDDLEYITTRFIKMIEDPIKSLCQNIKKVGGKIFCKVRNKNIVLYKSTFFQRVTSEFVKMIYWLQQQEKAIVLATHLVLEEILHLRMNWSKQVRSIEAMSS